MINNPNKYTATERLSPQTKHAILLLCDYLTKERTEDNARWRHIILSHNRISDAELKEWAASYAQDGLAGLRSRATKGHRLRWHRDRHGRRIPTRIFDYAARTA